MSKKVFLFVAVFSALSLLIFMSFSNTTHKHIHYYSCTWLQRIESCDWVLARIAKSRLQLSAKKVFQIGEVICRDGDVDICAELGSHLYYNKSNKGIDPKPLLSRACRDGKGGNMKACGLLGRKLQEDQGESQKAQKLLKMACQIGHHEFCDKP